MTRSSFKNFSIKALLFDISIIMISIYLYSSLSDAESTFSIRHPVIGFISVLGTVFFVPIYAMLHMKLLIKAYEKFGAVYDKWLKGLFKAILYPLSVLILLLVAISIGYRAGLYSHYAIGVPFTIITIALLVISVYLSFCFFLEDFECKPLTSRIHEKDIKAFLDKLEPNKVRIWFTLLLQPFIIIWINILLEAAGNSDLSSLEKFVFLLISGYLPLRVLTEFEPPFRPLNIFIGLLTILLFMFQFL
jgi:hypothetical protein